MFFLRAAGVLVLLTSVVSQASVSATDHLNRKIVLDEPAQRIISLAPNITELLFHIGAGDQIIGADEYSNYPEEAKKIIRVNNHAMANYELILSLQPDLVFAWHSGNGEQIINRLVQLGLNVFVIEVQTMEQLPTLFKTLGHLTGNTERAHKAASTFDSQLRDLKATYSGKPEVSAFYQIWDEPIMTFNGDHLVSDIIHLCRGRNVFAGELPLVPHVNIEAVIDANPAIILSSGSEDRMANWRSKWQRWSDIDAVKKNHLYLVPPDLLQRQSNRILEGAIYLCEYIDQARLSH